MSHSERLAALERNVAALQEALSITLRFGLKYSNEQADHIMADPIDWYATYDPLNPYSPTSFRERQVQQALAGSHETTRGAGSGPVDRTRDDER